MKYHPDKISILWLIVIFLVIEIGGLVYVFPYAQKSPLIQTNDPQVGTKVDNQNINYQTYTNDTYGFTIQYPSGWIAQPNIVTGSDGVDFCPPELIENDSCKERPPQNLRAEPGTFAPIQILYSTSSIATEDSTALMPYDASGEYYFILKLNDQSYRTVYYFMLNSFITNKNDKWLNNPSLSEQEVLTATYKIAPYIDGKYLASEPVVFPTQITNQQSKLTGNIYFTKNGVQTLDDNQGYEGFWINYYKFTDDGHNKALVYITGNYGASRYDDRAFYVEKENGLITTTETTCQKGLQGECIIN